MTVQTEFTPGPLWLKVDLGCHCSEGQLLSGQVSMH